MIGQSIRVLRGPCANADDVCAVWQVWHYGLETPIERGEWRENAASGLLRRSSAGAGAGETIPRASSGCSPAGFKVQAPASISIRNHRYADATESTHMRASAKATVLLQPHGQAPIRPVGHVPVRKQWLLSNVLNRTRTFARVTLSVRTRRHRLGGGAGQFGILR